MNTKFKGIDLTRFGIKPESTAPEADALAARSSSSATRYTLYVSVITRVELRFDLIFLIKISILTF